MKKLLLIPIFLFLCSPLAVAQDYNDDDDGIIENSFGIGPRLGYYHADDLDDGTFYYGLQARLRLGSVLGIEGSVSYRPGTEGEENPVTGQFFTYETKFVPITGSLMLFLPIEGFAPYILGGVGAYYTIYDSEDPRTEDWDSTFNLGYHLGFGAELPFSEQVALALDYRYIFLTPEGDNAPDDADFSGNVFTAGLMFYL